MKCILEKMKQNTYNRYTSTPIPMLWITPISMAIVRNLFQNRISNHWSSSQFFFEERKYTEMSEKTNANPDKESLSSGKISVSQYYI